MFLRCVFGRVNILCVDFFLSIIVVMSLVQCNLLPEEKKNWLDSWSQNGICDLPSIFDTKIVSTSATGLLLVIFFVVVLFEETRC